MKKLLIILAALLSALGTSELFTRYIVHFPVRGIKYRITLPVNITEHLPYSEYWDVESGNKVYRRNNMGLSGNDISFNKNFRNLVLLGNSFIEAAQVPQTNRASSILNRMLHDNNKSFQVINLASAEQDVYTSFLTLEYYKKYFKPDKVFLIIENINSDFYKKYSADMYLNFNINMDSLRNNVSLFQRLRLNIINYSSLADLIYFSYNYSEETRKDFFNVKNKNSEKVPWQFYESLKKFEEKYGNSFALISINSNANQNRFLADFCISAGIQFFFSPINIPENQINKSGHLNYDGNKKLAEFLYEVYGKIK